MGKTTDRLKRETSTLNAGWGLDAKEMAGLAALTRPWVWGWHPQISCSRDSVSAPYESWGGLDAWRTCPPSAPRSRGRLRAISCSSGACPGSRNSRLLLLPWNFRSERAMLSTHQKSPPPEAGDDGHFHLL